MSLAVQLDDRLSRLDSIIDAQLGAGQDTQAALSELLAGGGGFGREGVAGLGLVALGRRQAPAAWRGPEPARSLLRAIDGVAIGPSVGSCGTVAYLGHAIFVTDIAANPLWENFRELALAHGLRACWSTPIRDEAGDLIGTFAVYYREPRAPTTQEREAIASIGRRAAEIIRRAR